MKWGAETGNSNRRVEMGRSRAKGRLLKGYREGEEGGFRESIRNTNEPALCKRPLGISAVAHQQ